MENVKLNRDALKRELHGDYEKVIEEVSNAVDLADEGRWIQASENPVRDALARFRRRVYERAIQMKVDAAEAAFPPSAQRGDW